jgi:threonine/homoserine/homoserine lactone efflux protein
MWAYLALGLSMGLTSGLSPGPLLTLVVTASLRSGWAGGLRVALAPLLTDLPIVTISVLVVGSLPPEVLRWVGTAGGLVVIWLGIETLRSARHADLAHVAEAAVDPNRELWRGVIVNFLNPHPYLFWATVGGPALVRSWRSSPWYTLAFLLSFYLMLIGSKVVVAWLISSQAHWLTVVWYRRVLAVLGLLLLVMGGLIVWQMWSNGV